MLNDMDSYSKQSSSRQTSEMLLTYIHYGSPLLLLIVFIAAFIARSILEAREADEFTEIPTETGPGGKPLPPSKVLRETSQSDRPAFLWTPNQTKFFLISSGILLLTYLANAALVILRALKQRADNWWCGQSYVVYVTGTFFVFSLVLCSIRDTHPSPTWVHLVTWLVSLLLELIMLAASIQHFSSPHHERKAFDPNGGRLVKGVTPWESVQITIDLLRLICLFLIVLTYAVLVCLHSREAKLRETAEQNGADERTHLLNGHSAHKSNGQAVNAESSEVPGWARRDKLPDKSWWEYVRGYSLFFPYIWPSKSPRLQVVVMICLLLVALGRVVNVLVPFQAGRITDLLAGENGHPPEIPWLQISLYILFRLLQGGSGLLSAGRALLWLPISQYSYRELSVAAFEHVHDLSLDFHLGKKTGEVISALNKGSSINTFLQQITFDVMPMLVDLLVAIIFFISEFDIYYGLIVTLTSFTYMYVTIQMAQQRAEIRRDYTNLSRNVEAVKNDSLVSYETVKYFNAERYEFNRYRGVLSEYQKTEFKLYKTLQYMNLTQNLLFMVGLMGACFLSAFQISIGKQHVGRFVTLLTYMAQLQAPLNYFGSFYRSIQSAMISSERMLELFKENPTVTDKPTSRALTTCQGRITFNNVSFSYDPRRPAIQGLSFTCDPGTTTAFVGESGGGKSTIFRLLFRFYNVDEGSIEVDGINVQDIKIDSLRSHMGVVPQDTVLFNETIMYNLKYANQNATDQQVEEACKAASIHERILTFPDGYDSKVGERGLKLSGGEKQRIAIARTIIKNPRIILLDEATAALDTATEQNIQGALDHLSHGRTNLIIAHRLSTITNANRILVIQHGEVVEQGTHDELLQLRGVYADMWDRQIKAQKAAEKARSLDPKVAEGDLLGADLGADSSATPSDDEDRRKKTQPSRSASGLRIADRLAGPGEGDHMSMGGHGH